LGEENQACFSRSLPASLLLVRPIKKKKVKT